MNAHSPLTPQRISLLPLVVLAGCGSLWSSEGDYDPSRCNPRCTKPRVCFRGVCVTQDGGAADQVLIQDRGSSTDSPTWVDAAKLCSDPTGDWDGDGIPNSAEGCLSGRDSDGDKVPDWQDLDSDGDKIPDKVEAGKKDTGGKCPGTAAGKDGWPCDHDGDKVPDYLDIDSDDDGLKDSDEDQNGDGLVGCCLVTCGGPDALWQKGNCILTKDGCGAGQTCSNKLCVPPVAIKCSEGETSTLKKISFDDGKLDSERGTFICRDATEAKPQGRKPVQVRYDNTGDWRIAIEEAAKYGPVTIAGAGKKIKAATIDHSKSTEQVAGFVLSIDSTTDLQSGLASLLASIRAKVPGNGLVTLRASGIQHKTHDGYDAVSSTILDLKSTGASDVSSVRNELIATLLGKTLADLSNLSAPFGTSASEFVIRLTTIKRFEFKRDSSKKLVLDSRGNPIDSGDKAKWRLVVMGGVAARTNYQSSTMRTGYIMQDLSNGTAVAVASDSVRNECDVDKLTSLPVADIIWVIDESGSMSDDRQDIVNNANNFFSRALSSGLDFRMGVTNVCNPSGSYKTVVGKFCSTISSTTSHMGGTDRFLLPSEQTTFSSCIKNPPGYEGGSEYGLVNAEQAVKGHLPRATNAPDKIRTNATLVIIVATDEFPESLASTIGYTNTKVCTLPAPTQASVNAALKKYLDLFTGVTDPQSKVMFHVISGACNSSCSAYVAHGYKELAQKLGGQWGDVCQKNLGNTLQEIIDSVVGAASPIVLDHVPISSSLAVAMDAIEVKRSRTNGFDYRANKNSVVLINVKYKKGSEIVAAYKRWSAPNLSN